MRRSPLLLVAATLATGLTTAGSTAAGASSATDATRPVLTRAGLSDVHGVAAPVTLRCTSPTTASLTLTGAAPTGRAVPVVLTVDGRAVRSSRLTSRAGSLSVSASVTAGRPHTASLTVAGRVVSRTPAGRPVRIDCAPARAVAPVTSAGPARGRATSFSTSRNADGSVARWNPCAGPISVRVNAAKAPAGGLEDARSALQKVSAATGLTLTYAGATTFVPTRGNESSRPADIVVAWVPRGTGAGQSDYYTGAAVGVGAWNATGTSTDGRTWDYRIASGAVVLDPSVRLARGFGVGGTTGALLLHELAHVMGLGHVADRAQVMYPSLLSTTVGSYGAGDLAGLAAVGAKRGCTGAA